jgi:hypothetical protein
VVDAHLTKNPLLYECPDKRARHCFSWGGSAQLNEFVEGNDISVLDRFQKHFHQYRKAPRLPLVQRFGALQKAFNIGTPILCVLLLGILSSRVVGGDLHSENFPLRYADDHYVPENWKQTIAFLWDNLAEHEHFFILTDEISLYYFVGKECPVRVPLLGSVGNNEKYQKEIIV